MPDNQRTVAHPSVPNLELLVAKFSSAESLPDLPASALELCDTIDRGDANASELERIVLADPAITAGVLKAANSALYGGRTNQSSTIKGAILLLGHKVVRSVAVAIWVQALVHQSKGSQRFDTVRFAEHSMFVGFLSKYLLSSAQRTKNVRSALAPDELFAAGVLHDLGVGLLASVEPKFYDYVAALAAANQTTVNSAFLRLTGLQLPALGARAVETWGLPHMFGDVLNGFSYPLEAPSEVDALCCVCYADHLATTQGSTLFDWTVANDIDPHIVERVGIGEDDVQEVLQLVSNHTREFVVAA